MTEPVVLVVDDSPTIRKLVEVALRRAGVKIVAAPSGLEALAALAEQTPALILLDVLLPSMNGYQLCQLIRRNARCKQVPVVMLSGKDGVIDKVRGRLAGANEYLTKPFEPRELVRVVQKYLPATVEAPDRPAGVAR